MFGFPNHFRKPIYYKALTFQPWIMVPLVMLYIMKYCFLPKCGIGVNKLNLLLPFPDKNSNLSYDVN